MARKKKTEQTLKEPVQIAKEAFEDYLMLSRFLFAIPEESIYDVNELEPDEKFYQLAHDIADELKIGWEDMSHEDSNRIMLLMLERTYQRVRDSIDAKSVIIEYKLKKVEKEDNGSTKD